MNIIYLASLIALASGGACLWIVRRITGAQASAKDLDAWIDINWQTCRPIERLLDPTEFEFLRGKGMSKQRISKLRTERRKLFRMYLRRLTHEFNHVHSGLQLAMVRSTTDRPDLAKELGRQRAIFYKHLVMVEVRLAMNAAGFDCLPSMELIRPLERMHLEFRSLVPAMSGAQA
jgi:hypothetical protein